jgi:hypothetical protein
MKTERLCSRHGNRHKADKADMQKGRQVDRRKVRRQKGRQDDRRKVDRQKGTQEDSQTGRQAERRTDRQTR